MDALDTLHDKSVIVHGRMLTLIHISFNEDIVQYLL